MHNLEADGQQQQKTPPGATHLHYKKEAGKRGYNLQELTKIGQLKTGKMLPGLMSLNFCWDIQMVESEFGINRMRTCYHCVGWWCNGVGDVFLGHFRPLSANWASFKYHGLPEHCFWLSIPLWPPFTHPLMATYGRIMHHVAKLESFRIGSSHKSYKSPSTARCYPINMGQHWMLSAPCWINAT